MDELDTLAEKLYQSWRYAMVMQQLLRASEVPYNYLDLPALHQLVWRRVAADTVQNQDR